MNTSLAHLPEPKQARLGAIAALFRERVPLGLLVLFGSHARGDWVDDPETGYQSDFDLLAVVHDPKHAADLAGWRELEQRFREAAGATPVTLIVHDVKFVNREIRIGQYFFADIANEGVALHDGRHFALARPKALNHRERLALGEQNFTSWFDGASGFWRGCRTFVAQGLLSHAAFLLHQAAEGYYHAAALVFTGYKDRTHDIEALGRQAAAQHPALADFCGPDAVSPTLPAPPAFDEPLLANLPPLAARGLEVDAAAQARVQACADVARLDRWLARALTAASAREALDDG